MCGMGTCVCVEWIVLGRKVLCSFYCGNFQRGYVGWACIGREVKLKKLVLGTGSLVQLG